MGISVESNNPKAWVAKITGVGGKYGLQRTFLERMPKYELKAGVVGFDVPSGYDRGSLARNEVVTMAVYEYGNMDGVVPEWAQCPDDGYDGYFLATGERGFIVAVNDGAFYCVSREQAIEEFLSIG